MNPKCWRFQCWFSKCMASRGGTPSTIHFQLQVSTLVTYSPMCPLLYSGLPDAVLRRLWQMPGPALPLHSAAPHSLSSMSQSHAGQSRQRRRTWVHAQRHSYRSISHEAWIMTHPETPNRMRARGAEASPRSVDVGGNAAFLPSISLSIEGVPIA
jgi:hypothetical protein